MKNCGTYFVSILIGLALGYILGYAWLEGWLNPWVPVKGLPGPVTRILDASVETVVVQTKTGSILTCGIASETCQPGYQPTNLPHKTQCRFDENAITHLSPNSATVCHGYSMDGWDAKYQLVFGYLLRWQNHYGEGKILGMIPWLGLGGILGMIFGPMIADTQTFKRWMEKRASKNPDDNNTKANNWFGRLP